MYFDFTVDPEDIYWVFHRVRNRCRQRNRLASGPARSANCHTSPSWRKGDLCGRSRASLDNRRHVCL